MSFFSTAALFIEVTEKYLKKAFKLTHDFENMSKQIQLLQQLYKSDIPEDLKKVGTITFTAKYAGSSEASFEFMLPVKREFMLPVKREFILPVKREFMLPIKREFILPVKREFILPVKR